MANTPSVSAARHELVLEAWMPYRRVFDVVWSGRRHIMMMASQVDRFGNQNLSAIGDWARPKAQLIGVRGAPGNSLNHTTSYWVPAHTARSFVEHVDMVCGVGYDRAAAAGPAATRFHESASSSRTSACSTSTPPTTPCGSGRSTPAWPSSEVVGATGFELVVPDPVPTTRLPERRGARADPRGPRPDPPARQGDPVLTPDVGLPDPHPALHTRLCDLVGVRYPIVQTGMGWVAGPRLVAATANAGALGILASATMTARRAGRGHRRGAGAHRRALRREPAHRRPRRRRSASPCSSRPG